MAKLKDDSQDLKSAGDCQWCHHSPFRRTVHLLDMLDRGSGFDDLRRHLRAEFGYQAAEFHNAEIRSVEVVLAYYRGQKDERNYRVLPWVAWQQNKASSAKIAEIKRWLRPDSQAAISFGGGAKMLEDRESI